jgi:hypothetical protein
VNLERDKAKSIDPVPINSRDEDSQQNGEDSAQPSSSTAPSSLAKPSVEEEEKRPSSANKGRHSNKVIPEPPNQGWDRNSSLPP